MTVEKYNFQYCQKIILFDEEGRVLLARRQGEDDYNGVYSLIGGKMETTDGSFQEGLEREKRQEIGRRAIILVALQLSHNIYYKKNDGSTMVLPHFYGHYVNGEIDLNDEYSDYQWVAPEELDSFEPKIETIPDAVQWGRRIAELISIEDMTMIQ